jgi:hypothetical protein
MTGLADSGSDRLQVSRRELIVIALLCCLLAAVSLVPLSQVTGPDPNAWLSRAFGMLHGDGVDFSAGPAWKPLATLIDIPHNLGGNGFAAGVWLWIVRFSALWTSAMLFVLVRKDGGVAGATVAALLPLTIRPWLNVAVVGESETLALALVLTALVAWLSARQRTVMAFLLLAGLLRPEVWPLIVLQAIFMKTRGERGWLSWLIGSIAMIAVGWVIWPRLVAIGSGSPFSMKSGHSLHNADLGTIVNNTFGVIPPKAWLLIPFGLFGAWRARRLGPTAMLAIGAGLLIVEITVLWALHPPLSATGYTPVLRYFAAAGVMLCGVAGAGVGTIAQLSGPRFRPFSIGLAVALAAWSLGTSVAGTRSAIDRSQEIARSSQDAVIAVGRAGGVNRIQHCLPITISNFSAIGWSISRRLQIPLQAIDTHPHSPSVALSYTAGSWVLATAPPMDARGRMVIGRSKLWEVIYYPGHGGCLK